MCNQRECQTCHSTTTCRGLGHLRDDYSRENLLAICEAAVVQQAKWANRDSPAAHEQLGLCWVMLKAGCEFWICKDTDANTIWLSVEWKTFSTFEYGGGYEETQMFYLPTAKRLREREGKDWY